MEQKREINFHAYADRRGIRILLKESLSVTKITSGTIPSGDSRPSNFACYLTTYLPIIFGHARYIGKFFWDS